MRVIHVCYSVNGGAGRAALRLHGSLAKLGADSHIFAFDQAASIPRSGHESPGAFDKLLAHFMKNIDKIPNKLRGCRPTSSWSNNWAPNFTLQHVMELKPDVVNLHFIGAGTFPIRDFQRLKCPIVWTLHDMAAFTGGCHYSGGCERFREKCGSCPVLNSESVNDLSRTNWDRKESAWRDLDLVIVCPSEWLAFEARRSSLLARQRVRVIQYGIDLDCFRPVDKAAARGILGVPVDKFLIAFGAASLHDSRKGLAMLWKALRSFEAQLGKDCWELVVFGSGSWNSPDSSIPVRNLGAIRDDDKLALIYSAADVFCAPSREENLANTALESLACGTPVLAFGIGGFPDIIDHRRCGYLASPFEIQSLTDGLQYIYSRQMAGEKFREASRKRAEDLYDERVAAGRYLELYRSLDKSTKA